MKKNTPHSRKKRPTATIDLKAEEIKKNAPVSATSSSSVPKTSAKQEGSTKQGGSEKQTAGKDVDSKGANINKNANAKKDGAKKDDNGQKPRTGTPAKPPTSSKKPSSGGGGFMSHLLASVIGAVLGIVGISYGNNQKLLPASLQISGGQVIEQKMTDLSRRLTTLQRATLAPDPNSLGGRLKNLNSRLEQAEASLGNTNPGADTLAQKVARLETTLGGLESAARTGKGGKLAGLTAVTGQLRKANKRSLSLENELVKVREEQNSFREDLTSIRSKHADFISTSAKISDELVKMKNNNARIVTLAKRPPNVSAQINPVIAQLSALTSKIDGVLNREASSRAEGRDIGLALSLGELKRAVNEGSPFKAELARVAPHTPRDLDLAVLSQHADKGIITISALRTAFSSFSHKALASEHTATSGSFVDQMFANAKSMVQVRPTGLVEGATTGAILSRMEYKLARADLAGALQESKALTGSAKKVMQPWLKQAASRAAGNGVLRTLEDKIRNALAGSNVK